MNKTIDTRREAIIAEWNAVNDELRKLKAIATQLHQELIALKINGAGKTPPPKTSVAASPKLKSSKPLAAEVDFSMHGVSD